MVVPIVAAAAIAAGATIVSAGIGAYSQNQASKSANKASKHRTRLQKKQDRLIDDLLSSLHGKGKYSDLYSMDEDVFQKSFVEPAQAEFRNKIAPGIQQQYVAYGQQRSTGLDDALLRAGVDLNSTLNQYRMQYEEAAKNRQMTTINTILGQSSNSPAPIPKIGYGDAALQGGAAYLQSDQFKDVLKEYTKPSATQATTSQSNSPIAAARPGFSNDWNAQPATYYA